MDIKKDSRNYRKHSKGNQEIINKSLERFGAGRSILVDKDNVIIAGNGVYEQAEKLKIPCKTIETDGNELIVVKRTDLKSGDETLSLSGPKSGETAAEYYKKIKTRNPHLETVIDYRSKNMKIENNKIKAI